VVEGVAGALVIPQVVLVVLNLCVDFTLSVVEVVGVWVVGECS